MDYSKFINPHASQRNPSLIREMTQMLATAEPGTIFMAGGFPNPEMFPFESVDVRVDANIQVHLEGSALSAALQYQPTLGYPPLRDELKRLIYRDHKPPKFDDMDGLVTIGSQHGLSGIFGVILQNGDPVVVPQPVYSSALAIMDPYRPVYLAVPEDSLGMQPALLKSILDKWSSSNSHEQLPKILYVNPTGTNPTGAVIPTERKREIYQIAEEYDLLIIEDDPYYYLHFEEDDPVSFLSMDTSCRVIRLESFSKVFSSGIRVGFAFGPKPIIRQLELLTQHTVLHCSSLSQVIVHRILEQWGPAGFTEHTKKVKAFYRNRRNLMVSAAEKHLTGLAVWDVPRGGMFLWMKVLGLKDTYQMLMQRGIKQGIMLLPGKEFMPDRSITYPYVRASYSVASHDDIDKGEVISARTALSSYIYSLV
ncbi:unnamed protein product [Allacma fusca]|uniref:Aminotransferase class I/classII large domain-containing protein n=1 Tax=Allacma fusca TaxID=39272 RepID=A0A8J2LJZ0_9HEXA|nr:unnamed protein product [Allacma fusca]